MRSKPIDPEPIERVGGFPVRVWAGPIEHPDRYLCTFPECKVFHPIITRADAHHSAHPACRYPYPHGHTDCTCDADPYGGTHGSPDTEARL